MSLHAVSVTVLQMLASKVVAIALDEDKRVDLNIIWFHWRNLTQWKWICSKMNFSLRGPPIKNGFLFRLGNVIIADDPVFIISAGPPTLSQCPTNSRGTAWSWISASRSCRAIGDCTGVVDIIANLFIRPNLSETQNLLWSLRTHRSHRNVLSKDRRRNRF